MVFSSRSKRRIFVCIQSFKNYIDRECVYLPLLNFVNHCSLDQCFILMTFIKTHFLIQRKEDLNGLIKENPETNKNIKG